VRPRNLVTYCGGYASALRGGDFFVHIYRDGDQATFCDLDDGLRYGTPREIGKQSMQACHTCFRDAQRVRRDLPAGVLEEPPA